MQTFVAFEPEEHYFTLAGAVRRRRSERWPLFDLVVNNADRKGGHCLLGEDGRIWLIDHGVCFNAEPKLRTVIWEYMDEPIPHAAARRVSAGSASRSRAAGPTRDELAALLNEEELVAPCAPDRIEIARAHPRVPRPER